MRAKLRLPVRGVRLVAVVGVAIAAAGLAHGQAKPGEEKDPFGKKDPAAAKKEGQPDVKDDLDEAVRLLEAGDFAKFLDRYAPVEMLREIREQDAFDEFARAMQQERATRIRLISTLKQMRKHEPAYDKSRGLATFQFDPSAEEPQPEAEATATAPTRELQPGFGRDLAKTLAEAEATLAKKDYEAFVEKLFPPAALGRLGDAGVDALTARLKDDSEMAERMAEDLKALKGLKPEMADGGKTASFKLTVEAKGAKEAKGTKESEEVERVVRFSLIGDDWRFYDDTARVAKHLAAFAKRKARGSSVTIKMERIGGNWRLLEFNL